MSCQTTPYVLTNPSKLASILSQYYSREHTKSMTGRQPYLPPHPPPSPFFLLRETDFQSQTHNLSFLVVGTCHCTEAQPLSQKFTRGKRRGGDKGFSRVLTKSIFLDSSQKFTPSIGVILSGIFYGLGMKASSVFLFSILLTTKEMSKANEEFCSYACFPSLFSNQVQEQYIFGRKKIKEILRYATISQFTL